MSAKRPLDDAEPGAAAAESSRSRSRSTGGAGTDGTVEPYSSYMDVHSELVSLKTMPGQQAVLRTFKRAQLTAQTRTLPLAVQQIAVRLVSHLGAHPAVDSSQALGGLVQALARAEPSVRCEIYQALAQLHELKGALHAAAVAEETRAALERCVQADLNHAQHHVRCSSLAVLPLAGGGTADVFDTLCRYTADAHPKVRQTALAALLRQHMLGRRLPVGLYDGCVAATKDDFEQVRLAAVELLWAVCGRYPEHAVGRHRQRASSTVRLLDDAFVRTCDMINDSSAAVRQRACTILGRFRHVDGGLLAQTFSKQVMSNLKRHRARGGHAGRGRGARGGPAQGAIPTPPGDVDVDSDDVRLLDSGAAGAFVHGLEDEYQEVRDAAIESMGELSAASADFAAKSVDFLVDMFNDSSDRVRLCAVRALAAIGERQPVALTDEQLAIAQSAMKDASRRMRQGIYAFLAVALLPRPSSLAQLADAFKASLDRYPDDQPAIFRVLQALGRSHSAMVDTPFARSLLGLSEHYLSREPRIDDVVYAGSVILIMNTAADARRALESVLPDHVYSHLSYLRDKYPGCLPQDIIESVPARLPFVRRMLERPHVDGGIARLALDDRSEAAARMFSGLQHVLERVCSRKEEEGRPDGGCWAALDRYVAGFGRLAQDDGSAGQARQAVLRYARLVGCARSMQELCGDVAGRGRVVELAAAVMWDAYSLEARTLGLDRKSLAALRYLRLFAHAAWLHVHPRAQYDARVVARMLDELAQRCRRVEQLARAFDVPELRALSNAVSKDGSLGAAEVELFIGCFRPLPFALSVAQCQYATACFEYPDEAVRRTVEYNHVFPLTIGVQARVAWVARRQSVRLVARLPTQQTVVYRPPDEALKPLAAMHWALACDSLAVSLPLGSGESTSVAVDVAVRHEVDVPWSDAFIVRGDMVPLAYAVETYYKDVADERFQGVHVVVSDQPHTVRVSPVEFRPPPSAHTRA
ncbi:hypothetical protein GGI15_002593 [Coemansia interrupta]|uniref:Integrator complex subunit 4 n=1 Tax=Coemansia interrupta TaxID=1126814 RepID=A0A9W8LIS3_9FUNG|nr:hypothetical protein GGI15_002593 [Coemansia interrupta]